MSNAEFRDKYRLSFGSAAAEYDRVRPTFPVEAVDWMVPNGARDVVDVGAGTGKLTALLADRGLHVTAVEPDAGMRAQLSAVLPDIECVEGQGEHLPLPDDSVDLVTFAQSWHWADTVAASAEAARVLRPGGRLAMVWNTDGHHPPDWLVSLLRAQTKVLGDRGADRPGAPPIAAPFESLERADFAWVERIDKATLLDRIFTYSAYLALSEHDRAAERSYMEELLATHPEVRDREYVEIAHEAWCFRTQLTPCSAVDES